MLWNETKSCFRVYKRLLQGLRNRHDGHIIQSRIFASQGFSKLADRYAEHAEEERGYVKQCIDKAY